MACFSSWRGRGRKAPLPATRDEVGRVADSSGPRLRREGPPMLETSARLLRLLSLLQSRRFWRGGELAAALGVTERSVRRDVGRLRALGYPVHAEAGVGGGYQLGAGKELPPLPLEDEEAVAVAVGLRAAASGAV